MKRLAIFPHIISVVNLEKMSRRLWILGDFFCLKSSQVQGNYVGKALRRHQEYLPEKMNYDFLTFLYFYYLQSHAND